jgi:DNA sulfur modification protein DndB
MSQDFSFIFPAIRGIQANREYYASMCPLRILPRLFKFDDEELVPELRAQRVLNKARVPEIAKYVLDNPDTYAFSAITVSIDGEVHFEPVSNEGPANFRLGTLTVSMNSRFIVNDGQHRRAAIVQALENAPELGEETIAVVFFLDRGLKRCQQMFADLNRHAVKPSASLGILYDHRSATANVARHVSVTSMVFKGLIESERSSLSPRSRSLFTLSALHFAITELLTESESSDFSKASQKCLTFWELVGEQIPEWAFVRESRMTSGDVRRDFIHSHATVLQALGRAGRALFHLPESERRVRIKRLRMIDWARSNATSWEGRAMVGGGMAKSSQNITLTCNEIKRVMGIALTPEEAQAEKAFAASGRASNGRLGRKKK